MVTEWGMEMKLLVMGISLEVEGALQLTGKNNYRAFSEHLNNPEIIKDPKLVANQDAFESAIFFL